MKVDKKIKVKNNKWSFKNNVSKYFNTHVKQSVPFYDEGHDLIIDTSEFFLKDNSIFYDLGCSTGTFLNKISKKKSFNNVKFVGLDSEKNMINFAKKSKRSKKLSFFQTDLTKYKYKRCDVISSYYTIQFIPPSKRQNIINNIYKSLNWGGGFFMFEKVRAKDARFQDIMVSNYQEFKLRNNFKVDEIFNKTRSLRGILEPFSTYGNLGLLKRAGFVDIEIIMKYNCFEGYLAIK